jgi:aminopeptidase S
VKPAVAFVQQGRAVSFAVSTALTSGSAQMVNLSVTGLPGGTVAEFVPASFATGGKSALSLSVGRSTRPGLYPLKVVATGSATTHATTVWLVVLPHF